MYWIVIANLLFLVAVVVGCLIYRKHRLDIHRSSRLEVHTLRNELNAERLRTAIRDGPPPAA